MTRIGATWNGDHTHLMTPETRWGRTLCGTAINTTHEGEPVEATCPRCKSEASYHPVDPANHPDPGDEATKREALYHGE